MNEDDFKIGFGKLIKAFTVAKPIEKADIYFQVLQKIHGDVWIKTCDHALNNCEKFPTIMKLIEIADNFSGYRGRVAQACSDCDGLGTLSMWNHTFRARCIHGEKVSKYIPLIPVTPYDKQKAYNLINADWKKLYGYELDRGEDHSSAPQNIIDSAKDIFGMGRQDQGIMAEMSKIFSRDEKGCLRWVKGQKYIKSNLSLNSKLHGQWVQNGKNARAYFGDELVEKCWKSGELLQQARVNS